MRLLLDENPSESIAMRIRADVPDIEYERHAPRAGRAHSIIARRDAIRDFGRDADSPILVLRAESARR